MIEIDSDNGCFGNDFERSQDNRAEKLRYARDFMGISCDKPCEIPSPITGSLEIVGEAIRDAYNIGTKIRPPLLASSTDFLWIEQRERVSSGMGIFIETTEREHLLRLSSTEPSVVEYWECRLRTSAVRVCLAVNE